VNLEWSWRHCIGNGANLARCRKPLITEEFYGRAQEACGAKGRAV